MSAEPEKIKKHHLEFIEKQKLYFVGTAMADGRINISPKGMDSFKVMTGNRVVWMNLTGSGNETSTHVKYNPRMTILFCAFEGRPMILRLYGSATVYHPRDPQWSELIELFPPVEGARQLFDVSIDSVQSSCGFGIPIFSYQGERTLLLDWAEKKGADGIQEYWENKNKSSLDGHDTGILD